MFFLFSSFFFSLVIVVLTVGKKKIPRGCEGDQ